MYVLYNDHFYAFFLDVCIFINHLIIIIIFSLV